MDFDFEKFYFMLLDILFFSENIMFQFVWISLRIYLQNEATPEPRPATNWNGAGKTKALTSLRNRALDIWLPIEVLDFYL